MMLSAQRKRGKVFRRYPFAAILLGSLALVGLLCGLFYVAFLFGECAVDINHRVLSPDNRHKIIVLRKNCGATTAYSTQAVLLPAWSPFIAIAYEPFFVMKNDHALQVNWRGDHEVEIRLPESDKVYRSDPAIDGVRIIYTGAAASRD